MALYKAKVVRDEKMRMLCESGDHKMFLDEPINEGGTDKAMNPVQAMLSCIGACKCITAWAVAEKKGIKLKNIEYQVSGETGPIEKINGIVPRSVLNIVTRVKVEADNSEEEIKEFVSYIDVVCPVANTITRANECKLEIEII